MNATRNSIDWASLQTIAKIGGLSLMNGEAKQLTNEEIELFNTQLRIALEALEPVVEMIGDARTRYQNR